MSAKSKLHTAKKRTKKMQRPTPETAAPEQKASIKNTVMAGAIGYCIDLDKMAASFPNSRRGKLGIDATHIKIDDIGVIWWPNGRYVVVGLKDPSLVDAMVAYCLPTQFKVAHEIDELREAMTELKIKT
jgi:hypothetical protein